MEKLDYEKLRKRDIVIARGADPISKGIRRNDEYLSAEEVKYLQQKGTRADEKHPHAVVGSTKPKDSGDDDDDGTPMLQGVSQELLNWYFALALSHPDTRIVKYLPKENGEIELEISRSNQVFFRELERAVVALDETRKKSKK